MPRWLAALALLAAWTLALAQERAPAPGGPGRVRIGGGADRAERTRDWPHLTGPAAASDADLAERLTAYLDALSARDLFSGTVLVARDDAPVFLRSWGLASKDFAVPNGNETKYNVGSITKSFTRLALEQLRAAGKVDFSKPLRTYLPDYPSPVADRITLQQLLDHTSGLGDFFGPEYFAASKARFVTLADYLPLFVDKPLAFEPGQGRAYSNSGYVVLGLVVERMTGASFHDHLRKAVFEPADMKDSGAYVATAPVPNRAVGYTRLGPTGPLPGWHSNVDVLPWRASSAGGTYSTAGDLMRYAAARKRGKLGGPPFRGEGVAGGLNGGNAVLEVEGRWTVVVLSNYDPPGAEEVAANVRTLLGPGPP